MMQAGMFPPHPGGMQPAMPQHHPGMPPNGAQHMAQPMHMAPNASGPGGPQHMAQTTMMGMQPGGGNGGAMNIAGQTMGGPGANAMALSHLTPQASLMQQQQQQQQQQAQFQASEY